MCRNIEVNGVESAAADQQNEPWSESEETVTQGSAVLHWLCSQWDTFHMFEGGKHQHTEEEARGTAMEQVRQWRPGRERWMENELTKVGCWEVRGVSEAEEEEWWSDETVNKLTQVQRGQRPGMRREEKNDMR